MMFFAMVAYMEMCMCVAYLEANSCRNGSKKALYFNSFLNPCGTRIFRFPGARGERKITFYRFHYHEVASFLLSEYPTKIHLKSARHDTKIVQKSIQNRFQGCLKQNFGFSWRRLRIKKPMKPDSSAGGARGARKTHPLDDQDGGKTVKKSMPKWIKKSMPFGIDFGRDFLWILGGKMEAS